MLRIWMLVIIAAIGLVTYDIRDAQAISPSQQECEAQGGTYTNESGTKVCTLPEENVGNAPDHSNSQTTQTTYSGQGNTDNKHQEECSGPPGQCK